MQVDKSLFLEAVGVLVGRALRLQMSGPLPPLSQGNPPWTSKE